MSRFYPNIRFAHEFYCYFQDIKYEIVKVLFFVYSLIYIILHREKICRAVAPAACRKVAIFLCAAVYKRQDLPELLHPSNIYKKNFLTAIFDMCSLWNAVVYIFVVYFWQNLEQL